MDSAFFERHCRGVEKRVGLSTRPFGASVEESPRG